MKSTIPASLILAILVLVPATARLYSGPDFNEQAVAVEKLSHDVIQMHSQTSTTTTAKSETLSYDIFDVQSSLDAHRNIWWQTVGRGNSYNMKLERDCFCPDTFRGPFEIRVRNGGVDSATYDDGGDVTTDILEGLPTVEGVMDQIQDGLNQRYVELNVRYHSMGRIHLNFTVMAVSLFQMMKLPTKSLS